MYTRIHGVITLRTFIATNTPDLTYAPRVIHYPINLTHCHLTCQSLSLLRLSPVRCDMVFVRFCTGERSSIAPHHGLPLPHAQFLTIRVGWFVPSYTTILRTQPLPDLDHPKLRPKFSKENFNSKFHLEPHFHTPMENICSYEDLRSCGILRSVGW